MSRTPESNLYLTTADELQALASLTEEAKLYREAAKDVFKRPENEDAGPEERALTMSSRTLDDLLKTVNEEREQNKLWKQGDLSTLSRSAKSIVSTLGRFEKAISSMAQAKAEITMLIWGPIQFLVRIAGEIFDTLERLNEIGQHLKHCLDRYKIYTSGHSISGPLRSSLVDFYAHLIQFSVTTSKIYRRRKIKTAAYVFWKSVKEPFEDFLKGLDYLSDVIDKDTNAENFRSIRNLHSSPAILPPPVAPAIPGPETRYFFVPDLLSNNFSGRHDVLDRMHRSLNKPQTDTLCRTAIWGIPGVGKTQIALRFAGRYQAEYQHVFYINATSSETIIAAYRAFAHTLPARRSSLVDPPKIELHEIFNIWLAENESWLLIYDNATEPVAVRRHTPVKGRGHILFTTRNEVAAEALVEQENAYEVSALPVGQAVPFILGLQKLLSPSADQKQVAERLATTVLGLPIAIEQTVLLSRLRKVPLVHIIPEIENRRAFLKQSHPASMHENECSTGALLSMTLDTLAASCPHAASLFRLLVYFETSSIPISFLTNASKELQHHFRRQEIYDRGQVRTAADAKVTKERTPNNVPFYESNPFEKDFWRSRNPFRSKTRDDTLPRVDTDADKAVERYFKGNRLLQDVLEKDIRVENALLDLRKSGLVRRLNDKTIWIHDLYAKLTIATVEEESKTISQSVAHLVLLMIYVSFQIPDYRGNRNDGIACLPHAICILEHCSRFHRGLTMYPELAHLTASTLDFNSPGNDSPERRENVVKYYKLALRGYHHASQRLRSHPNVRGIAILKKARAEYDLEYEKGIFNIHTMHTTDYERFGSSPVPRAIQTLMKLGYLYSFWNQYAEALPWMKMAVQGSAGLYGQLHDETMQSRAQLLFIYKELHEYGSGHALGHLMAKCYMERWGGGLISEPGASIAYNIGDCAMGLGMVWKAGRWYQIALRGMAFTYGEGDRTLITPLMKLARVERLQHNHGRSLEYALRAKKIYHDTQQLDSSYRILDPRVLTEIQVAIASQHFELGNANAGREWCEKAFAGPKWVSLQEELSFEFIRSLYNIRLEAIWIWGCVEYGESYVQEWEIPGWASAKDLTRDAVSTFGALKNPCCAGTAGGKGRRSSLRISAQLQRLIEQLDEPTRL